MSLQIEKSKQEKRHISFKEYLKYFEGLTFPCFIIRKINRIPTYSCYPSFPEQNNLNEDFLVITLFLLLFFFFDFMFSVLILQEDGVGSLASKET